MSNEDEVRQNITEMAKLSVLTDRLSEVQVKNLKMFPFVFFEGVTKAEIAYDLSNQMAVDESLSKTKEGQAQIDYDIKPPETDHLKVSYYLTLDEAQNHLVAKRCLAIQNSVRNLFWKQVKVDVYFNGKRVWTGA